MRTGLLTVLTLAAVLAPRLGAAQRTGEPTSASTTAAPGAPTGAATPTAAARPPLATPSPRVAAPRPEPADPPVYYDPSQPTLYRGGRIPAGMHVEWQRIDRLIVGGTIMFGITWLLTALGGLVTLPHNTNSAWLLLPVAGPLVLGLQSNGLVMGLMAGVSLLQGAGVAMIVGGAVVRRPMVVLDRSARNSHAGLVRWALVPTATGDGVGLAFALAGLK
jgi:hypothetical protein